MIIENGKTIFFERKISKPSKDLFSLWSNSENIPRWWSPNVAKVDMNFKEGGAYKIHWTDQKDPTQSPYGVVTKIENNSKIEMTWRWDAISPDFDSKIFIMFDSDNSFTNYKFKHVGIEMPGEVKSHHEAWEQIFELFCKYALKGS